MKTKLNIKTKESKWERSFGIWNLWNELICFIFGHNVNTLSTGYVCKRCFFFKPLNNHAN